MDNEETEYNSRERFTNPWFLLDTSRRRGLNTGNNVFIYFSSAYKSAKYPFLQLRWVVFTIPLLEQQMLLLFMLLFHTKCKNWGKSLELLCLYCDYATWWWIWGGSSGPKLPNVHIKIFLNKTLLFLILYVKVLFKRLLWFQNAKKNIVIIDPLGVNLTLDARWTVFFGKPILLLCSLRMRILMRLKGSRGLHGSLSLSVCTMANM